ncbi:MAG: hypothetical protein M3441_25990 [Chloroflexota bacterium]|nr:hypothetical protein [Chloroflexota bacterium]
MARRTATTSTTARLDSDGVEVGLPRREFLLLWVAVSALSSVANKLLFLATSAAGIDLGLLEYAFSFASLILPQWFVLSRYLLHFSAWEWLWRYGLGLLLGIIVAALALVSIVVASSVQPGAVKAATENQVIVLVTLVALFLVIGLAVGLAVWPMLRRYAPGQPWQPWAFANAIFFGLGVAINQLAVILGYSGPISDFLTVFASDVLGSLLTGYVLLKILHQPISLQLPAPTYTPRPRKRRRRK